jgi:hypothetical protein
MMGGVGGGVKVGVGRVKALLLQAVSKRERMRSGEMGRRKREEEAQVFIELSVPKKTACRWNLSARCWVMFETVNY